MRSSPWLVCKRLLRASVVGVNARWLCRRHTFIAFMSHSWRALLHSQAVASGPRAGLPYGLRPWVFLSGCSARAMVGLATGISPSRMHCGSRCATGVCLPQCMVCCISTAGFARLPIACSQALVYGGDEREEIVMVPRCVALLHGTIREVVHSRRALVMHLLLARASPLCRYNYRRGARLFYICFLRAHLHLVW